MPGKETAIKLGKGKSMKVVGKIGSDMESIKIKIAKKNTRQMFVG